jgi:outer membrane protein TolC
MSQFDRPSRLARLALACMILAGIVPPAAGAVPLPEPLTLEAALALADDPHPDLLLAEAELDLARADELGARARSGLRASLEARARWVEPSDFAPDRSRNDSMVGLLVRKRLYDFGRDSALRSAAGSEVRGREHLYQDARHRRRIAIMERYFAVLLADIEHTRNVEAQAVAFVSLTRLRDRHELGQISDIDLREAESRVEEARRRTQHTLAHQRVARARLAEGLHRPGELPAFLAAPALPGNDRELPDVQELIEAGLARNPTLLALRAQVHAAQERLRAARAEGNPILHGEFEAYHWEREFASRDDVRAGLLLEVPLYTGGAVQAATAAARAELSRAQAGLAAGESALREALLDTWQRIATLQAQRREAGALRAWRDLYLDRSRALYELEVRADLGDATVRMVEADLLRAHTDYALALAWAELDAWLGEPLAP